MEAMMEAETTLTETLKHRTFCDKHLSGAWNQSNKITTHSSCKGKFIKSCLSAISSEHHWHSPVSKPDVYASIVVATPQVNFGHQHYKLWKVNQEEGSPEKELRKHMGHLLTCCQFWRWYTSPDLLSTEMQLQWHAPTFQTMLWDIAQVFDLSKSVCLPGSHSTQQPSRFINHTLETHDSKVLTKITSTLGTYVKHHQHRSAKYFLHLKKPTKLPAPFLTNVLPPVFWSRCPPLHESVEEEDVFLGSGHGKWQFDEWKSIIWVDMVI